MGKTRFQIIRGVFEGSAIIGLWLGAVILTSPTQVLRSDIRSLQEIIQSCRMGFREFDDAQGLIPTSSHLVLLRVVSLSNVSPLDRPA